MNATTSVNPDFLTASVLDASNPRTRIRHARLDREFGRGNWTEIFVDAILGGGTVRDNTGKCWDWFPHPSNTLGHGIDKLPA